MKKLHYSNRLTILFKMLKLKQQQAITNNVLICNAEQLTKY